MATRLEQSLQRDVDHIRAKVREMGALAESALRDGLRALEEKNRVLAYSVILRDQRIDELEKEVDRLCLEFIVRQQPVAGLLRLAYATIRINLELERVGDYAEAIARQVIKLGSMGVDAPSDRFAEIASLSIPMLHDAVEAFASQDADLARAAAEKEERVDALKRKLNADLMRLSRENKLPFEALNALMMIARHYERVSDQASNICAEVLYMCTGVYSRHQGTEASRLVFVGQHNACRSQMAEAIANSLGQPRFVFSSAGLAPTAPEPGALRFLAGKGLDVSKLTSKGLDQLPDLKHYHIVVALGPEATRAFPRAPTKVVCLEWDVPDPSEARGTPAEIEAAYEAAYRALRSNVEDLVRAIVGQKA